jgi:hypothetical protein
MYAQKVLCNPAAEQYDYGCFSQYSSSHFYDSFGANLFTLLMGCSTKDELEYVVEDKIAPSTVRQELKSLTVAHGLLFLIDLMQQLVSRDFGVSANTTNIHNNLP